MPSTTSELLKKPIIAINVGLKKFAQSLQQQQLKPLTSRLGSTCWRRKRDDRSFG